MPSLKPLRALLVAPVVLLAGCNAVLLAPSGDVAVQQRDLIYISTALMLLIVLPVIAATLIFAWRYRANNAKTEAEYDPEWHHSTMLELMIWSAPLLIIIALGALTWTSTHLLDPYRPLDRIAKGRELPADAQPLVVEVVALDWKWLFLYPEQGVASVNEMALPVDRPVEFRITASTVMNSFFVPAMAGQIYAMPGMQTTLHGVINQAGVYEGFSANYSGAGFSHMRFKVNGVDAAGFDSWVQQNRTEGTELTRDAYMQLEQPSEREPVRRYAAFADGLYDAILNRCVEANRMCMRDIMAVDAAGGLGLPGIYNVATLDTATRERLGLKKETMRPYVGAICTIDDPSNIVASAPAGKQPT